jgi:ribonuclease-3
MNEGIDAKRKAQLLSFEKAVGIRFKDIRLLNLAFIHRSASNEAGLSYNNERLEFLGDSVLGLATTALLFKNFPESREGDLAKIKSAVVSAETLCSVARELQIDDLLILGRGEDNSGGRNKKNLLSDALEALFGAIFIDSGYKTACKFIEKCMLPEILRMELNNEFRDYKTILQEECQKQWKSYPQYRLIKREGPEHDRFFWVEVNIKGEIFGPGRGKNKKSAEQEAAKIALDSLKKVS